MKLKIILKSFTLIFALNFLIKSTIASCIGSNRYSDPDCYLRHSARENVIRMGTEGGCDVPKQQIVYPHDWTKNFIPRGTLLYRCSDIFGCCPHREDSCQPIREEQLQIAFYTIDCRTGDNRLTPEYIIMRNHTKCGCRPRMENMSTLDGNLNSLQTISSQRQSDSVCGQRRQVDGQSRQVDGQTRQVVGQRPKTPSYATPPYGLIYPPNYKYHSLRNAFYVQTPRMQVPYNRLQMPSQSKPCKNSLSSGPMINGQVVRGIILPSIEPEGQTQCNYR